MPENGKPLDISGTPDLLRLAEEVQRTKIPRLLKRGDKALAKIVPIRHARHPSKSMTDQAEFLASAGSWKGIIDADQFVGDIYESRRLSTRPQVDL